MVGAQETAAPFFPGVSPHSGIRTEERALLPAEMSCDFLDNLFRRGPAPAPPPPLFPGRRQSVASLSSPEGTGGHEKELKASPGQAWSPPAMPEVHKDTIADPDADSNSGPNASLSKRPHIGAP